MNLFIDTETIGLCGVVKLIQYGVDNGPVQFIKLFRGWEFNEKTRAELYALFQLIDRPDTVFVAFNAAFDLTKLYNLRHWLMGYSYDSAERPIMPFACRVLDLQIPAMLKSPLAPFAFNRAAGRSVAVVRRIPKSAQEYTADLVLRKLKPLIPQSFELKVGVHAQPKRPDLVSLSFNVNGRVSLKGLMREYGLPTIQLEEVWPLPDKGIEKPWLPYPDTAIQDQLEPLCDAIMRQDDHAFYRYSKLDILYLRALYEKLGHPEPDYNSDCVHSIAYGRYFGFDVDHGALSAAEEYYGSKVGAIEKQISGINLRSSKDRLELLKPHFPLLASTNKKVLKHLAEHESGTGAELAAAMLEYGPSRQRLLQIQKVGECLTGRAHPDLRVMGTATNRMAGTSGLNWQGIGSVDEVELELDVEHDELDLDIDELAEAQAVAEGREFEAKQKVGLRHAILTPCVGDWSSFEVVIAAAVYNDKQLQEDIQNKVDLHSMGSVQFHPLLKAQGVTYDEFKAGYKHNLQWDKIRKGIKAVIFGSFYFCTAHSVAESLNIPEHEAQKILDGLYTRYPGMLQYRAKIEKDFITADTEGWGRGSVSKMSRSLVDLTGFERHWDFEAGVAECMWELGTSRCIRSGIPGKVTRNVEKGPQSVDMAITSACLGSALAIQAAVSRQAGNFRIQCTGATLTKQMQAVVWRELRIPCLPIHDELVVPHHPNFRFDSYSEVIDKFVAYAKGVVPMVKFDYAETERWSDK